MYKKEWLGGGGDLMGIYNIQEEQMVSFKSF